MHACEQAAYALPRVTRQQRLPCCICMHACSAGNAYLSETYHESCMDAEAAFQTKHRTTVLQVISVDLQDGSLQLQVNAQTRYVHV